MTSCHELFVPTEEEVACTCDLQDGRQVVVAHARLPVSLGVCSGAIQPPGALGLSSLQVAPPSGGGRPAYFLLEGQAPASPAGPRWCSKRGAAPCGLPGVQWGRRAASAAPRHGVARVCLRRLLWPAEVGRGAGSWYPPPCRCCHLPGGGSAASAQGAWRPSREGREGGRTFSEPMAQRCGAGTGVGENCLDLRSSPPPILRIGTFSM